VIAHPQPAIADILGIRYANPIDDAWGEVFHDSQLAPAPPTAAMFTGPLGALTRVIAPHVPWDPVAFHMQALVALGNFLGYAQGRVCWVVAVGEGAASCG
jgi:hypothetical protein